MFGYLRSLMKHQTRAYLYALASIACWSTVGSAFKLTLRHVSPAGLLVLSSAVACLVLLLILAVRGQFTLLRRLTLREAAFSAFLGFLNPFLYYTVLLVAYDRLRAQEAGTLNYIWPLVLVLLSIPMLKQRISMASIAAILISFGGILVISLHPDPDANHAGPADLFGVSLAIASAFVWALYWIFNLRDGREAIPKLFLNFCFGFVYSLLYAALTGAAAVPSLPALAGGAYLGIFEMGLTFVLWLQALKYSSTTAKVSNLIYLSPFLSLIFIYFVVKEPILPSTLIGLVLIVAGIILQQSLRK